jgi:hypothetical protein
MRTQQPIPTAGINGVLYQPVLQEKREQELGDPPRVASPFRIPATPTLKKNLSSAKLGSSMGASRNHSRKNSMTSEKVDFMMVSQGNLFAVTRTIPQYHQDANRMSPQLKGASPPPPAIVYHQKRINSFPNILVDQTLSSTQAVPHSPMPDTLISGKMMRTPSLFHILSSKKGNINSRHRPFDPNNYH